MLIIATVVVPVATVSTAQLYVETTYQHPVVTLSCQQIASKAKLDELKEFIRNGDGIVHFSLYCTPTYFQEDYVVRPSYV